MAESAESKGARAVSVTIDRVGLESALVAAGFELPRTYLERARPYLRPDEIAPGDLVWPDRVQIKKDKLDTTLIPSLERTFTTGPEVARLRSELEGLKARDPHFPSEEPIWDDTKKTAFARFKELARELGVEGPKRVVGASDFIARCDPGTFVLSFDRGGWRSMAGSLPIYFYFRPHVGGEVFLSDLRWLAPGAREYFVYVFPDRFVNGCPQAKVSIRSAIHGMRASLVMLRLLAEFTS
jgi:hypothetical protein